MWKEVVDFVQIVEKTWKVHFQDGYNPDIKFMAHLWEPLRYHFAQNRTWMELIWLSMSQGKEKK